MTIVRMAASEQPIKTGPFTDWGMARKLVDEQWGDDALIVGGRPYGVKDMTLTAAWSDDGQLQGVACHRPNSTTLLLGAIIVTGERGSGIGRILFDTVVADGKSQGMRRMRAVTTNDNFQALRFLQRCGMHLEHLYPGGADAFRAFKTGIHRTGQHGLPMRDIIELAMEL